MAKRPAVVAPCAITVHDRTPRADAQVVDQGIGAANNAAAPLADVQELACFARDAQGAVLGGAVGRTWGACAELLQLWVHPAERGRGTGTRLMQAFEARARERGVRLVYLDTFSFQAEPFYAGLGYQSRLAIAGYSAGIRKFTMIKEWPDDGSPP